MSAIITMESTKIDCIRLELEKLGYYDRDRRIVRLDKASASGPLFALPITDTCKIKFSSLNATKLGLPHPFKGCSLSECDLPLSKKLLATQDNPCLVFHASVRKILEKSIVEVKAAEMLKKIPKSWERHGDMIVFPPSSFSGLLWSSYFGLLTDVQSSEFWSTVAKSVKCKRISLDSKVCNDDFRSSGVRVLLGTDGWVDHLDNSIHYIFDVTKCIFSSGNITEKLRVACFRCHGETVVDMYAGVGYFTFPYLVHAGAKLVHACEWNPHAVDALRRGLQANKIEGKCIVHDGDSRKVALKNTADRVNLGLLPSSEEGWPVACAALKTATGGWLHIHGNITTKPAQEAESLSTQYSDFDGDKYTWLLQSPSLMCADVKKWIHYVSTRILDLLGEMNPLPSVGSVCGEWKVEVRHVEHVKQYAPHVRHLVLDVECRPFKQLSMNI